MNFWRRLCAAVLVWSVLAGAGITALADEVPNFATWEECIDATNKPCYQTGPDSTWEPDMDPALGGGGVDYDPEYLDRTGRSMPLEESGTVLHPVVAVDFEEVTFPDVQPELDVAIGRVRVPIRFVSEKMGAVVTWDQDRWTATFVRDGLSVLMQVNNPIVQINGQFRTLDAAPVIKDGRIMVPIRHIAEVFGATVDWVGDTAPAVYPRYTGKYQVWIWIPWGYWGTTGLETRLQSGLYRRD